MNKKLKYLSIIPLYGTCILFLYLFILSIKEKISKKKFFKSFLICAIVSAICYYRSLPVNIKRNPVTNRVAAGFFA